MTREALLAALDELKDPEFDRFKWHLMDERSHKHLSIAKTKLEHAERCDTVDLMIGVFTTELMVVTATRDILAKLQRNDLSRKLKKRVNEHDKKRRRRRLILILVLVLVLILFLYSGPEPQRE